jgi:thioredoxin-dependent peroxiredoxin
MKVELVLMFMMCGFLFGCATVAALKVGVPAPDFTASATGDRTITLSSLRGQWVVLYFYPKAHTPGCTKESCSLRDGFQVLKEQGAVVLGVSLDKMDSQTSFKAKHALPFDLISDADKKIATAYGVLATGRLFTRRETFIIDPNGRIAHIFDKVNVDRHDAEVLDVIRALKAAK